MGSCRLLSFLLAFSFENRSPLPKPLYILRICALASSLAPVPCRRDAGSSSCVRRRPPAPRCWRISRRGFPATEGPWPGMGGAPKTISPRIPVFTIYAHTENSRCANVSIGHGLPASGDSNMTGVSILRGQNQT